jgi:hypothetical protein
MRSAASTQPSSAHTTLAEIPLNLTRRTVVHPDEQALFGELAQCSEESLLAADAFRQRMKPYFERTGGNLEPRSQQPTTPAIIHGLPIGSGNPEPSSYLYSAPPSPVECRALMLNDLHQPTAYPTQFPYTEELQTPNSSLSSYSDGTPTNNQQMDWTHIPQSLPQSSQHEMVNTSFTSVASSTATDPSYGFMPDISRLSIPTNELVYAIHPTAYPMYRRFP